ncbi:MAG: hypothetical protein ACTSQE_01385 [Candidatus Heimdallarchaeaceae archaeon]
MVVSSIVICFFFPLLVQICHIFEEIGMEVHKVIPSTSLSKYLVVVSIIITISMLTFLGILFDLLIGYILGIIVSVFAVVNGSVHIFRLLKYRKLKGTLAGGLFTGIPLLILGVIVFIELLLWFL